MATNNANTVLAVGCEDGCVRLFDIADGEFTFIRSFDKQRSMSLDFFAIALGHSSPVSERKQHCDRC